MSGTTFQGGGAVQYSGKATDGDGNEIPASGLSWWALFRHGTQVDTVTLASGAASGTLNVSATASTSADISYRLVLVASSGGLVDTATRDLDPETVQLTLASVVPGRTLTLDGAQHVAPYTTTAVVGMQHELGAPSPQVSADSTYSWQSWSDGGNQTHTVTTPSSSTTYTATYTGIQWSPPTAVLTSPTAGTTYHGGSTITIAGTATDMHGTPLTGAALSWWAVFHHDTHTHPYLPETQGGMGQALIPTSGEVSANVWYRFFFRAVDSHGLADTVFVDVLPETVQLTVTSVPVGRTITLDGQPHTAPYTVTGVVGITRAIGAPSPQSSPDSAYAFQSWSDAGANPHTISTPAVNTTYTATFTATGPANQPPTVAINQPAANANLTVNVATTVTATASDPDGTVSQVEFFDGATSLGVDNTSPFSVNWTPTVLGAHSLTARATDNGGASTTSAARPVTVVSGGGGDTQAPTVTLTSPTDGATGLLNVITATANATDNVGVVGVTFQLDGVTIGEATTAPYSMDLPTLAGYASGPHQVRARARDAAGNLSPWAVARITSGGSVAQPNRFTRTAWIQNLGGTGTAMAFAPDGRLFICEQEGSLRVVTAAGQLLTTPFLTLNVDSQGERGLLGVTFDPDFANNNYIYVYYTVPGATQHNRVSRFTANGNVVVPNSEQIIFDLLPTLGATNHNGGAIHFGPDGKLYVAVGENADPFKSPSATSFLGKILRLNSDGSIPADNPSIGTGNFKAIWARGFRNPFTFGFQPVTNRMFINDVGEATWEEINEGVAGANYGWPNAEGIDNTGTYTNPLFTYRHSGTGSTNPSLVVGQAIVGSAFYPASGGLYPAGYAGNYFFADYVSQWINRLDLPTGNSAVYAFARLPNSVTDLAVGPDGKLYALAVQQNGNWGVFRFDYQ
ncbi:MAG TPA: PQQ-dependent sugar dehydrogenase [Gemmatimonadales bacterium]|nr:PQQ-dependent sugar dehydrogenase [Gemmatimonadales bacterium]